MAFLFYFIAALVATSYASMFDPIDAPGCGQRPLAVNNGESEINSRIVGGSVSQSFSWPALCSLRLKSDNRHRCGSNLVRNMNGDFYLITAAHCTDSGRARDYVAYCGIFDRVNTNQQYRQIIEFSSLTNHPNYNSWTLDYDMSIFRVSTSISLTAAVQAVCLPNENWNVGENAIVAGWGTLTSGGNSPYTLHQVNKPIKSRSVCRDRYGSSSITGRMMCAGLPEGGKDACQGDSGGPLYTYVAGRWTLTGVVSWGYGCGESGYPGVYADVLVLKAWVDSVIN